MVTCTELATLVTTQENSFMVWGSRPLIKSPLHTLLSQHDHTLLSEQDHATVDNTNSSDASSSDASKDDRMKKTNSDILLSHKRRVSSVTFDLTSPNSTENVRKTGSIDRVHKSSSLNLSGTPHAMIPCSDAGNYMLTLTQSLRDMDQSRGRGGREDGRGGGKRGPSVSSEPGVGCVSSVEKEGIILEPTSLDLVGRSGLLSNLSAQGLQQPKLEGMGHYAGNVLILIEARVSEEEDYEGRTKEDLKQPSGMRINPPKQPLLLMSKKFRERRHLNR